METSFLDLRCKEVVNLSDGRRLGHIIDIAISVANACVIGILVPGEQSFWNILRPCDPIFIPWNQVAKIGEDTIFVELNPSCQPFPFILGNKK